MLDRIGSLVYRHVPRPGRIPIQIPEGLRVLLMSSAFNNLSRRIEHGLEKYKVQCESVEATTPEQMESAVNRTQPDVILCPYMIQKIPGDIFCQRTRPCLIVHPGIPGDRGVSSLDFAIRDSVKSWGVTVLQAEKEYDSGDIWSSEEFTMPENITKTALYNGLVADVAVRCSVDAVSRYTQGYTPVALGEETGIMPSTLRSMKKKHRRVDWNAPAYDIARLVRMSDTRPGALADIKINHSTATFRFFDAEVENGSTSPTVKDLLAKSQPGDIVAHRHNALLMKSGDAGGVWIGQMKRETTGPSLKLPALDTLKQNCDKVNVPNILEPCCHDDVRIKLHGHVCYLHFDFYNGAMSTEQATRLKKTLEYVNSCNDIKVVALMGGERFFSTGINLNTIEGSNYKQLEAWSNINAINDVIKEIVTMADKAFVAVLQGNAGAGGAMLAAACDIVVSHPGVLLTPSYKAMNLYGSEYWTYFFPKRVGEETAKQLIFDTTPMFTEKALSIGLIDHVIGRDKLSFYEELPDYLEKIVVDKHADEIIREKRIHRDSDWRHLLQKHRDYELSQMSVNFHSEEFLTAMHKFAYHL